MGEFSITIHIQAVIKLKPICPKTFNQLTKNCHQALVMLFSCCHRQGEDVERIIPAMSLNCNELVSLSVKSHIIQVLTRIILPVSYLFDEGGEDTDNTALDNGQTWV